MNVHSGIAIPDDGSYVTIPIIAAFDDIQVSCSTMQVKIRLYPDQRNYHKSFVSCVSSVDISFQERQSSDRNKTSEKYLDSLWHQRYFRCFSSRAFTMDYVLCYLTTELDHTNEHVNFFFLYFQIHLRSQVERRVEALLETRRRPPCLGT